MNFNSYKPIRLIELFAGIGSQAKALANLGLNFEHWRVCEFDEHAVRSYNAVHGTNFVTSDITKISATDLGIANTDEFTYLLTYSFPCQDLSNAGKGRGMEKGSGTRSGLLWEVERLLNECDELPQVLLMENVPQVHSAKNKEHFDQWIAFLESKGYSNYWQDLNAKDYGIPQSRNRCYMVSILSDYSYEFPTPIPLDLRLGDLLEQEVDEKYYLSDAAIEGRSKSNFRQYNLERSLVNGKDIHPTILARYDGSPTLLDETLKREVCNKAIERELVTPYDIIDPSYANSRLAEIINGSISTKNSEDNQIANCITTAAPNFGVCVPTTDNRPPFITMDDNFVIVREATKLGYAVAHEGDAINLEQPNSDTRRGRVGKQVAQTLTTSPQQAVVEPRIIREEPLEREGFRCGDNGIFKGVPVTLEQVILSTIAKRIYGGFPYDGKYIIDGDTIIICQSHAKDGEILVPEGFREVIINPLGYWTGGTDVDTGATNRKLGSDMADSVTGGGLHGKDLSKADVSVNIYAFLKAQESGKPVSLCCAIGDDTIDGRPYSEIVEIAREYINGVGGFEKFAEWGLV